MKLILTTWLVVYKYNCPPLFAYFNCYWKQTNRLVFLAIKEIIDE